MMVTKHFIPQTVYCWGSQCCLKCVRLSWVAVSASLVLCFSCLKSCLPSCLPAGLGCRVCGLGLSQEFYARFVQLFGVYGGVIDAVINFLSSFLDFEMIHHKNGLSSLFSNNGNCFLHTVSFAEKYVRFLPSETYSSS